MLCSKWPLKIKLFYIIILIKATCLNLDMILVIFSEMQVKNMFKKKDFSHQKYFTLIYSSQCVESTFDNHRVSSIVG